MVQNSTANQLGNKWWIPLASQVLPHLTRRTQDAKSGRPHPGSHFFPGLRILPHFGRHPKVLWTSGLFKKYILFQKQAHEPIHFSRMAKRLTRFNTSKGAEFPLFPFEATANMSDQTHQGFARTQQDNAT